MSNEEVAKRFINELDIEKEEQLKYTKIFKEMTNQTLKDNLNNMVNTGETNEIFEGNNPILK